MNASERKLLIEIAEKKYRGIRYRAVIGRHSSISEDRIENLKEKVLEVEEKYVKDSYDYESLLSEYQEKVAEAREFLEANSEVFNSDNVFFTEIPQLSESMLQEIWDGQNEVWIGLRSRLIDLYDINFDIMKLPSSISLQDAEEKMLQMLKKFNDSLAHIEQEYDI